MLCFFFHENSYLSINNFEKAFGNNKSLGWRLFFKNGEKANKKKKANLISLICYSKLVYQALTKMLLFLRQCTLLSNFLLTIADEEKRVFSLYSRRKQLASTSLAFSLLMRCVRILTAPLCICIFLWGEEVIFQFNSRDARFSSALGSTREGVYFSFEE